MMSRTIKYLMDSFSIDEKKAGEVLAEIRRLEVIEDGENMVSFHYPDNDFGIPQSVFTDDMYFDVAEQYTDSIMEDTGEVELACVENVVFGYHSGYYSR